jgi:hypothetical protein
LNLETADLLAVFSWWKKWWTWEEATGAMNPYQWIKTSLQRWSHWWPIPISCEKIRKRFFVTSRWWHGVVESFVVWGPEIGALQGSNFEGNSAVAIGCFKPCEDGCDVALFNIQRWFLLNYQLITV